MPEAARAALPALFISDLHLTEDEPANAAAFLDFLHGPARAAASLFILGDLFEYWAGDDDLETPFNARIAAAIRALADTGTAVFFMTGNRDLLAGPTFAAAIGATLLEDPARVRCGDRDDADAADAPLLLLAHGDALCTDDLAYQAFRRQVRDPAWQAGFLAQPLAARKAFIAGLRQKSEAAKAEKAMEIMDVNADAVAAARARLPHPGARPHPPPRHPPHPGGRPRLHPPRAARLARPSGLARLRRREFHARGRRFRTLIDPPRRAPACGKPQHPGL